MKDTHMASSSPLLSVRHLRVEIPTRQGPLVALDDVSFDIARGEIGPAFSMPVRELDKVGRADRPCAPLE